MKSTLAAITASLCLLGIASRTQAATISLYNGVTPGGLPGTQSLVFGSSGAATQTYDAANQWTVLDTTPPANTNANFAGYSPTVPLTLNRTTGYTLSFTVGITAEAFTNAQRAGFSVIVVSSDVGTNVPSSIEIGFQTNRVFDQNGGATPFTSANQSSTFNPVGVGLVNYDLTVQGSGYTLAANGATILSGALQDYVPFSGLPDPYETPNFVFLGDDTSSARGITNIRSVSFTTPSAVPFEFSPAMGVGLLGVWGSVEYWRQRKRH